jgi:phage/plasmid-associated DNA primase
MATDEYREEMDMLAEFLGDCCVFGAKQFVQKKALYLAYTDWCEGFRQRPMGYSLFCRQLSERGYTSQPRYVKVGNTKKSVRVWIGIGLRVDAGASVPRSETSVWN